MYAGGGALLKKKKKMYAESLVPLIIRLATPSNFWGKKNN